MQKFIYVNYNKTKFAKYINRFNKKEINCD